LREKSSMKPHILQGWDEMMLTFSPLGHFQMARILSELEVAKTVCLPVHYALTERKVCILDELNHDMTRGTRKEW
jgi:hypothetical protein